MVEDEFFVAAFIERGLKQAGFGVIGPHSSVEAALGAISESGAAISESGAAIRGAVLDVALGHGQTSLDIARELQRRGIPYLFMTGDDSVLTQEENAPEAPVVLIKPVRLSRLLDELNGILA